LSNNSCRSGTTSIDVEPINFELSVLDKELRDSLRKLFVLSMAKESSTDFKIILEVLSCIWIMVFELFILGNLEDQTLIHQV
jgi:hypothetical protein